MLEREILNEQIILAIDKIRDCECFLDTEGFQGLDDIQDLLESDYVLTNYPFSFSEFVYEFTSKLEDCIIGKTPYDIIDQSVRDNLTRLQSKYNEIINFLELEINFKFKTLLILNLLISYKVLILLNMKGDLKEIHKDMILQLRDFANYILNNNIKDKEKSDKIMKELDIKINDYLCDFIK